MVHLSTILMVETINLLRELLEYQDVRLFYSKSGEEERWDSLLHRMMALMGTFGPHFERERIRGRTKDALRRRIELGRVAGGVCYGYKNGLLSRICGSSGARAACPWHDIGRFPWH